MAAAGIDGEARRHRWRWVGRRRWAGPRGATGRDDHRPDDGDPGGPAADRTPTTPARAPGPRRGQLLDLLRRYWGDGVRRRRACSSPASSTGRPVDQRDARAPTLYDDVAYGLPALQDGRWWTFFTGMFFAPQLVLYMPILAPARHRGQRLRAPRRPRPHDRRGDRRAVPRRAADARCSCGPSTTAAGRGPRQLGQQLDLGISAGGFALLGALTAVMQPVWRNRDPRRRRRLPRSGCCSTRACCGTSSTSSAFGLGVVAGPFLAGRAPVPPQVHFNRRTQRAHRRPRSSPCIAVTSLIEGVFPGNGGPFHSDVDAPSTRPA